VPDSENRAMNTVKTSGAQPARSALAVNARAFELLERDHTMLPSGDPGDDGVRVDVGAFCIHGDA
jgi:hypothetical protein